MTDPVWSRNFSSGDTEALEPLDVLFVDAPQPP